MTPKTSRPQAADSAAPELTAHEKEVQALNFKIKILEHKIKDLEARVRSSDRYAMTAVERVSRAHEAVEAMARVMTQIADRQPRPELDSDIPF